MIPPKLMRPFRDFFARQFELMTKFHPIELVNLPHTYKPLDSHYIFSSNDFQTYGGQRRLRELIHRIMEELYEVGTARPGSQREEIADVFHFLLEFWLVIGFTAQSFDFDETYEVMGMDALAMEFTMLGYLPDSSQGRIAAINSMVIQCLRTGHSLKARPWKQNPKPTSEKQFQKEARLLLKNFVRIAVTHGMTHRDLEQSYFGKAAINDQRVEEGQ